MKKFAPIARITASLLAAASIAACASSRNYENERVNTELQYELEARGAKQAVVITTPTAGWRFQVDDQQIHNGAGEIYITGFAPEEMTAQVITQHVIPTQFQTNRNIQVHIRKITASAEPAGPYRPVALADE
ncbi:MAG: hypothetical protein VYC34_02690 [Planctomycetota bacterium]|nr:hypothetical protein [Planctomycetota bacterium]